MPRIDEIRASVNNSSIPSTPYRAKTISLPEFDFLSIVDLVNDLQGESAIEDFALFLSDTSDEQLRGMAAESLLKFYANTRTVTALINRLLKS